MKKTLLFILFSIVNVLGFAQVVTNSPTATEFVRYQRVPVSYFNGLPNIGVPLYTAKVKDIEIPISLSYHASGVKVNQLPTYVGLGWNLNVGGGITRVINAVADETNRKDTYDLTGILYEGKGVDVGYYHSSKYMERDDWYSKERIESYMYSLLNYDTEPDEFIINACGLNGSVYFYRDQNNVLCSKVKSGNGETFKVLPPVLKQNPTGLTFASSSVEEALKAYRLYDLFYEFTVIKQDGTKLIFGGDYDCIEFSTERCVSILLNESPSLFLKTRPTTWMLREIISPTGVKARFTYERDGSPIVLSDVRTDLWVYELNGNFSIYPSQDNERGKYFQVLHPLYPHKVVIDNELQINFSLSKSSALSTVREEDEYFLQYDGFSDKITDYVCYRPLGSKTSYASHNYFKHLIQINIKNGNDLVFACDFGYTNNSSERLKLNSLNVFNSRYDVPERYEFRYNSQKLPPYNATLTDNWGYSYDLHLIKCMFSIRI